MKQENETTVTLAEFVGAATRADALPPPALAEVAFCGRSNVGKSSLLNSMMQRRSLARTSSTPGCTRQINVFHVRVREKGAAPLELYFVDLPGYGYAKRSRSERAEWGPMIEGYLRTRPTLRAVVLLVDARRGVEGDDRELVDFVRAPAPKGQRARPVAITLVATKLDKIPRSGQKLALTKIQGDLDVPLVGFSAVTGEGCEKLWGLLRRAALD